MRNVIVARFVLIILVLRITPATKKHLKTFIILTLDIKNKKTRFGMLIHTKL